MYQNIYQISANPIDMKNWISAEDFFGMNFIGEIANHIDNIQERESELRCFGNWLKEQGLGSFSKDTFILTEKGINSYFSKKFIYFKELAHKTADVSEQHFLSEPDYIEDLLSELTDSFSNRFDIYVLHENNGFQPISTFLREADCGKKYYIGGICKYQY